MVELVRSGERGICAIERRYLRGQGGFTGCGLVDDCSH